MHLQRYLPPEVIDSRHLQLPYNVHVLDLSLSLAKGCFQYNSKTRFGFVAPLARPIRYSKALALGLIMLANLGSFLRLLTQH